MRAKSLELDPSRLQGGSRLLFPPSYSLSCFPYDPDPELCEPRQRKQSGDPGQGAELRHHHPGEGEDPRRRLQEHALLSAAACCGHGPGYGTETHTRTRTHTHTHKHSGASIVLVKYFAFPSKGEHYSNPCVFICSHYYYYYYKLLLK